MANVKTDNVYMVEARYIDQRIPRYRGNALIEALPPMPSDEVLIKQLLSLPDFSSEQQAWPAEDRLQMIGGLSTFLLPLERHLRLARALDTLIRSGYVGRAPDTPENAMIYQELYEAQMKGVAFLEMTQLPDESQLSSSLIGMSGVGKTTALRRNFRRYPQVIYHPRHHIYQVPFLHIEAPHDGMSVKALAGAILRKLDLLVPDSDFYDTYVNTKGRSSGEMLLINLAAHAMHTYKVGILVVDEIQNLSNKGTSKDTLMSALVSAANQLGVPIVFVGTNKALSVLGLNFRQARRSVGHGFQGWAPFKTSRNLKEPADWEDFIMALWMYQWISHPVELTQRLSDSLYHYCQGVPDLAIKFFACAQWRAILDETETFSVVTFQAIADDELAVVKPMIEAMRIGDIKKLREYDDIPNIRLDELGDDAMARYQGPQQPGADLRPGDPEFGHAVANVLMSAGFNEERADALAKKVENEGKVVGIAAAAKAALGLAQPRRAKKGDKASTKATDDAQIELAPDDYRQAIIRSKADGVPVLDHLVSMGAACRLEQVLGLV